jgi:hypothetical protein
VETVAARRFLVPEISAPGLLDAFERPEFPVDVVAFLVAAAAITAST